MCEITWNMVRCERVFVFLCLLSAHTSRAVRMQVKIGPNTQENDLRMKLDKAKEMVEKMYRVRLFIPYRMKDRENAVRMLQRLREICTDFANVAGPEGIEKLPANTVVVYLTPKA